MKYIENERREKIIPRHLVNLSVDKENRKGNVEYLQFPDTHPSFDLFARMDLVREIKENICKIPEEK
jgi:hypothetical protein